MCSCICSSHAHLTIYCLNFLSIQNCGANMKFFIFSLLILNLKFWTNVPHEWRTLGSKVSKDGDYLRQRLFIIVRVAYNSDDLQLELLALFFIIEIASCSTLANYHCHLKWLLISGVIRPLISKTVAKKTSIWNWAQVCTMNRSWYNTFLKAHSLFISLKIF